jgi:hypothetical protein
MSPSGIKHPSSYFTGGTLRLHYRVQPVNAKIRGFHCGDYEECRLLGYKSPVRTSQEAHYVSNTESGKLMLCKISGFHGSDYEGCRLLGYKSPVRTSEETDYFSATWSSRLRISRRLLLRMSSGM